MRAPLDMRALLALAGLVASFLLAPALADALGASVPATIATLAGWALARALVPVAQKLQSEDAPRAS